VTITAARVADLTSSEREAIRALSAAVYPPDEWKDWPGKAIEWVEPEWCVRVWDDAGALVSYAGVILRQITHDDVPLRIGGVGGIKTHPAARGRGYARLAIERAFRLFHDEPDVAFALLVCEPHLLAYYSSLGWREFTGRLLVTQRSELAEFTFNRVMTRGVRAEGPITGVIDLHGAPW
jgi:aminoglycoside 2'-N-acetyltransferase I